MHRMDGVPVVASNICGIPYQVDDGQTGLLFPPGDIAALADKLSYLMAECASALVQRHGYERRTNIGRRLLPERRLVFTRIYCTDGVLEQDINLLLDPEHAAAWLTKRLRSEYCSNRLMCQHGNINCLSNSKNQTLYQYGRFWFL